ncbi:hypothetical protein EVC45_14830 [Paraburkholderia sp. UYCP14C]|uniref:hypothetical protein n=1 Tax=Paraburkholderia sp. UYCP14C TaxID=2511130 RepID=UPI00102133E9|nr:hypothetical protein [Paraburkholderia sp. UYCP14C]RZF29082.1 hypothetical protein EVC45_14830 [Paraburkholderia sp. UYCP14C]
MATPEHDASRERRLRRVVADLSELAIDDIEAIWSALSQQERARLRPLLADAARVAPGNLVVAITEPATDDSTAISGEREAPEDTQLAASQLERLAVTLPNELLCRLMSCVSASTREAVIAALPPERRAVLMPHGLAYDITERARAALKTAALAACAQLADVLHDEGMPSQVELPRLRQRLRGWIGRSA